MFSEVEQSARARISLAETGLFWDDFSVNALSEQVQDQSLEQLVGVSLMMTSPRQVTDDQ